MFEDALMESGGRIRTQRGRFSGIAAACNGSLVCLLTAWPLLHPTSLPKQTVSMLIAAPAPPASSAPRLVHSSAEAFSRAAVQLNPFAAPPMIPNHIGQTEDRTPPGPASESSVLDGINQGAFDALPDSIGTATPPQVRAAVPPKLAISSGVMEGRKLSGADPRYPAIARAARVQGMVVLSATISTTGAIENLRVVSGPPMLIAAAQEAVRTWRYRPYLLNGRTGCRRDDRERDLSPGIVTSYLLASANARADSRRLLTDSFDTDSE